MPYKNISAGRLGSTAACGELYKRWGLVVSRDRLYEITEIAFGEGEVQKAPRQNRYYTPEQLEILATAYQLKQFGYGDAEIRSLLRDPETVQRAQEAVETCAAELRGLSELVAAG